MVVSLKVLESAAIILITSHDHIYVPFGPEQATTRHDLVPRQMRVSFPSPSTGGANGTYAICAWTGDARNIACFLTVSKAHEVTNYVLPSDTDSSVRSLR